VVCSGIVVVCWRSAGFARLAAVLAVIEVLACATCDTLQAAAALPMAGGTYDSNVGTPSPRSDIYVYSFVCYAALPSGACACLQGRRYPALKQCTEQTPRAATHRLTQTTRELLVLRSPLKGARWHRIPHLQDAGTWPYSTHDRPFLDVKPSRFC
jgi:hypothetical protein